MRAVERVEAGVGVGVQEAAAGAEQRRSVLGLAVGRVAVEGGRRHRRAPRTLVADHHPQAAGLGFAAARIEHRDGRVVGVHRDPGPDKVADRLHQRVEQEGHGANPPSQDRAVELDAAAGVDHALPVQRLVIAVLRDQDVGEQPEAWPATLDRQGRHRRLHDRLARPAAQLRSDMTDDLEGGRHVLEHLALVLAQLAERGTAAARTSVGGRVHHHLARQVLGQRPAGRRLPWATGGGKLPRIDNASRLGTCPALGLAFLEIADQQLELLDVTVELLREAAEPGAAQHGELRLQLLDVQRLGVELGVAGGERLVLPRQRRLQRRRKGAKRRGIGRQVGAGQRHALA